MWEKEACHNQEIFYSLKKLTSYIMQLIGVAHALNLFRMFFFLLHLQKANNVLQSFSDKVDKAGLKMGLP